MPVKVAKNTRYGGFGLSPKAIVELIEMDSELVEKSEIKEYSKDFDENPKNFDEYMEAKSYSNKDFWDTIEYEDGTLYYEHETSLMDFDKGVNYRLNTRMRDQRHHPDLIKILEDLGDEANGEHANIVIKEIPDEIGDDYIISEYDGKETIKEPHRSW